MDERARRSPWTALLLATSLGLNIAALGVPFMEMKFLLGGRTIYTMFAGVKLLWDSGLYALAVLVVGFSIVFPFAKLVMLAAVWAFGDARPQTAAPVLRRVESLGKWSMLDVFLVGLMLALTTDQWAVSTVPRGGVACFLAAVVLSMLAGLSLAHRHGIRPTAAELPLSGALQLAAVLALLFIPVVRIRSFWLADRPMTFTDAVGNLASAGSWSLAAAVAAFLVIAPAAAGFCQVAGWVAHRRGRARAPWQAGAAAAGHWAMLDVFALALAVFLLEGRSMVPTEIQPGAWVLVGVVVLQILARSRRAAGGSA